MDINNSKSRLRTFYLNRRDSLSENDRLEKSSQIITKLKEIVEINDCEDILIYFNYRTEVITGAYIEELLNNKNERVYLPKVEGDEMDFYRIEQVDDLISGYKGIMEPLPDKQYMFNDDKLKNCLIIIPGSVFDTNGMRIGYGKGFYDRYLSRFPGLIKVALAFDCQIATENIPADDYDISMDFIITESKIMDINYT